MGFREASTCIHAEGVGVGMSDDQGTSRSTELTP